MQANRSQNEEFLQLINFAKTDHVTSVDNDGKILINEVIEPEDKSQPNLIGRVFFQVAENLAMVDALLETLVDKSILSNDEATKIRDEAIARGWENRYAFFRVEDIDAE